jgi:hypothetical protein
VERRHLSPRHLLAVDDDEVVPGVPLRDVARQRPVPNRERPRVDGGESGSQFSVTGRGRSCEKENREPDEDDRADTKV